MKKNRLFPFSWIPASWGLSGKVRQQAEASYYYEGVDLRKALHDIDFEPGSKDHEIEGIRIEHEEGKLSDQEMEKKIKTAMGEPWIGGDVIYGEDGGMYFDFDWNKYWIEELRQNGYTGDNDDQIMKKYFAALCYSEVIQHQTIDGYIDPFLYESSRQSILKLTGQEE